MRSYSERRASEGDKAGELPSGQHTYLVCPTLEKQDKIREKRSRQRVGRQAEGGWKVWFGYVGKLGEGGWRTE